MEITFVIILILVGILFFLVELFLIPGISIAGIIGGISTAIAVWYAYTNISTVAGNLTLLGGILSTGIAIWLFVKSKTLEKMSLQTNIIGNTTSIPQEIQIGDTGETLSRLAPMGKVIIRGITIEAKTNDQFIDQNQAIIVKQIYKTNILVEAYDNTIQHNTNP